MKITAYTFRTYPDVPKLESIFGNIFIFGKLKEDLRKLTPILLSEKPDYLIGIAQTSGETRIEPYTINCFGNDKVIERDSPDRINLNILPDCKFNIASTPTTSFCNWTMYKLAHLLNKKCLKTKLVFIHLNVKDIDLLKKLIQGLTI